MVMTYWLNVKDVMRNDTFSLSYETKEDLAKAYKRYSEDTDYEVVSMHSTKIETNVISPKELFKGDEIKSSLYIEKGEDLIKSDILKFRVENGQWLGEVEIEDGEYYVIVKDLKGAFVRKVKLSAEKRLGLYITVLKYR